MFHKKTVRKWVIRVQKTSNRWCSTLGLISAGMCPPLGPKGRVEIGVPELGRKSYVLKKG